MLIIDNDRVSDRDWIEARQEELEQALVDADSSARQEAYCCITQGGERVGPHHEMRDGVMILNRRAVWMAFGSLQGEINLIRRERVEALTHLRRHFQILDRVQMGE